MPSYMLAIASSIMRCGLTSLRFSQASFTMVWMRAISNGWRLPSACTTLIAAACGGTLRLFSACRSCERWSLYRTYARAIFCSPARIMANSTWSWISSMCNVPPEGRRRLNVAVICSVSAVTVSLIRGDAAAVPPSTAKKALVIATAILSAV